jgi:hypothetical protein
MKGGLDLPLDVGGASPGFTTSRASLCFWLLVVG